MASVRGPLWLVRRCWDETSTWKPYGDCFGRGYSPFEVWFAGSALRMRVLLLVVVGE
ncbi:hypothetical protein A2U01_0116422 [Trifolium medium]|uniref:Uncharacterized protein n=1 Tax=Trifolium medium TaxID=97028 RepID=A0A392W378_9FABA|nr:hypothetical protein [Trifolium medium]